MLVKGYIRLIRASHSSPNVYIQNRSHPKNGCPKGINTNSQHIVKKNKLRMSGKDRLLSTTKWPGF